MSDMPPCPSTPEGLIQSAEDVQAVADLYDRAMTAALPLGKDGFARRDHIGRAWHEYRRLHPQADDTTEGA